MNQGASPCSGDRVRAVVDERSAGMVEGVLHLRHVPRLGYVQVLVLDEQRAWSVRAESIEVLEQQVVSLEQLEASDPLVGDPDWRRVTTISEATEEGLLQPPVEREGGSWDDLFAELALRARPLLDAGWRLVATEQEDSWEYGDSVFYDLERNGVTVELEYYEHGQLVAYPMGEEPEDGVTEPLLSIPASTPTQAEEAFVALGLLP